MTPSSLHIGLAVGPSLLLLRRTRYFPAPTSFSDGNNLQRRNSGSLLQRLDHLLSTSLYEGREAFQLSAVN